MLLSGDTGAVRLCLNLSVCVCVRVPEEVVMWAAVRHRRVPWWNGGRVDGMPPLIKKSWMRRRPGEC